MSAKEAWEDMQASSFVGGAWGYDKWEVLEADLQEEWKELLLKWGGEGEG